MLGLALVANDGLLVSDNAFSGWATGIYLNPGAADAEISGNVFTGNNVGVSIDGRVAQELSALHAPVILIGARHEGFDSFFWDDVAGARLVPRRQRRRHQR